MSEFGALNLEDLQGDAKRLNEKKGNNFQDLYVRMPEGPGSVTVRILPPAKGGKLFQYTRLHNMKKPGQSRGRKVHCPRPLNADGKWDWKFPCIICDYYSSLWKQVDKLNDAGRKQEAEDLKKVAQELKPLERYYYNAIVRKIVTEKGEQKNAGPRILSIGKQLHKLIVETICGTDDQPKLDVTSIKAGYDFVIRNDPKGTGPNAYPDYARSNFARDASPAGDPDEIKGWAGKLNDLAALRILKDADFLKKELARYKGLIPDSDDSGFDNDAFEAEYRSSSTTVGAATGSTSDVTVAADGTASGTDGYDEYTGPESTTAVEEDISIEDEEFINDMKKMEAGID